MKSLNSSASQKLSGSGDVLVDVLLDSGDLVELDLSIKYIMDIFTYRKIGSHRCIPIGYKGPLRWQGLQWMIRIRSRDIQ